MPLVDKINWKNLSFLSHAREVAQFDPIEIPSLIESKIGIVLHIRPRSQSWIFHEARHHVHVKFSIWQRQNVLQRNTRIVRDRRLRKRRRRPNHGGSTATAI